MQHHVWTFAAALALLTITIGCNLAIVDVETQGDVTITDSGTIDDEGLMSGNPTPPPTPEEPQAPQASGSGN